MFLISEPLEAHEAKIRNLIKGDEPELAVLLAAADFERTVRRAIMCMGTSPTAIIAVRFGSKKRRTGPASKAKRKYWGLDGYRQAWADEIQTSPKQSLHNDVIKDWKALEDAFQLRHDLVHGDQGTTGIEFASTRVNAMMAATRAIYAFVASHGSDLHKPVNKRIKRRRT